MAPKVLLVVQPSLSHYRESLVRALLESNEVDWVLAGRYPTKITQSANSDAVGVASEDLRNITAQLQRKNLFKPFFWDTGLLRLVLGRNYDLLILEGNIYSVSSWMCAVLARLLKKKVVFWGHGWKRAEKGLKLQLRLFFYHLPHAHFVYGHKAADYAKSLGFPSENWHIVYNSLYPMSKIELGEPLNERKNDTLKLVFSGRLTKRHGVDLLIHAVSRLRSEDNIPIEVNIVGSGSEYESLLSLVGEGKDAFTFFGAQHDLKVLRDIYAQSHFAVSPGASGLNVIQALGFGVPVIAAMGDPQSGPEIEAVQDGKTGLLFEHSNIESLMDVLRHAYAMPSERRASMIESGREIVRDHYNADKHATAIIKGIKRTLSS